eukprot:GEMP01077463.1.p1 GENE.GEMP01077463.1~~GEMP01077463.1.p1  ORF type:complete len:204 (+),score=25.06 GEMP01077463.1:476-1087(+)
MKGIARRSYQYTPTPLYVWTHPHQVVDAKTHEQDVFSACRDGIVRHWSVKTGILVDKLSNHGQGNSVFCVAVDRTYVVSGGSSRKLHVWDRIAKQEKILTGHTDWITSVALDPKGGVCASCGGADQTLRLWNLVTGQTLWEWSPQGNEPVNTAVWGEVMVVAFGTVLVLFDTQIKELEANQRTCEIKIVRTVSLPHKIMSLSL